jgi:outer membrane receptor protein involved in Fe transport
MARIDHNFSNTHSVFARYTVDDSSSLVPYVGTPPGTYMPGFPTFHLARNQYVTIQDRTTFAPELINELRFGVNRTTASSSPDNTHPGLSISLEPDRPFGMIDVTGLSLIGNYAAFPLGDYSTVYQVQDQLSRTIGRHTLKFGAEFRRLDLNGTLDFGVNGLYEFEDLTPFGLPASSNNPALEFFLEGVPLSYVGVNPSNADSERGYRETFASGFAQDFVRVNSRFTANIGLRYDFYSNPTEAHGRLSAFRNPATDSAPTSRQVICRDTTGSSVTAGRLCMGRLRQRQDYRTQRVRHLSRPVSGSPVRSRPVSGAFFRCRGIRFPAVSKPAERSSDPAARSFHDDLLPQVPIRDAIQPQCGAGTREV